MIVIFGAGGHAKVVLEAIRATQPNLLVTVLDDGQQPAGANLLGAPIVTGRDWLSAHWPDAQVALGIGNNAARQEIVDWLLTQARPLATVIHPAAVISPSARIGGGSFLAAGGVVNADAGIGEGVIINTGASVDHDCVVGSCAHIAPGARLCGGIRVGARALIGAGAVLIPGVSIGADAVVGAGSVVLNDVPAGSKVAGCPAEPI
jgi:acetyltransferase EpsM